MSEKMNPEVNESLVIPGKHVNKEGRHSGRSHVHVFLMILLIAIPPAQHAFVMSFYAPHQVFYCSHPPFGNFTLQEQQSIQMADDNQHCYRYSSRNMSEDFVNGIIHIVPCDKWSYETSRYGSTLLSKFNLVCGQNWLVSLSESIYFIGCCLSLIIFGYLSDKYGRKPVILIANCITVVASIVTAFSPSFLVFCVCRFLVGFGVACLETTTFALLMEMISSELRSTYGIAVNFGWCFGFVSLPGIVYLLKDWFWIQIVLTAPSICLLCCYWVLPESSRWLRLQGQQEKVTICPADFKMNQKKYASSRKEKGTSILSLFQFRTLRYKALIVFSTWFVADLVYYGLSFNTNDLAGDPFVNFALSGAVEIPAYLITMVVLRSVGRKKTTSVFLMLGGSACLLTYVLPEKPWWLSVAFTMIGKGCVTATFAVFNVYTSEIFPTVIRNQVLGAASLSGRVGTIIAPFSRELSDATHPVVPQIVFGSLSVISGLLVLLLPETKGRDVPDTFHEAEQKKMDDNIELKEVQDPLAYN